MMTAQEGERRILWRDEAGGRFYLVPSAVTPAAGRLLLRSGATRTLSVRAAAVARYEVSRDEARAFLDARLGAFAAEGKRKVEGALAGLGVPVTGAPASASPAAPDARAEGGPGVRLFAALTGESAETVGADREAFARGVGTLLEGAAALLRRASEGPEGEADARERLRAFGETLRAHGIAAPDGRAPHAPAEVPTREQASRGSAHRPTDGRINPRLEMP